MKTYTEFMNSIHEGGKSYIVRDQKRIMNQQSKSGINPDNPDRMDTNLQFKTHLKFPTPINYSRRDFVPAEPTTVVKPARSREFGSGRKLRDILPGGSRV